MTHYDSLFSAIDYLQDVDYLGDEISADSRTFVGDGMNSGQFKVMLSAY